MRGLSRAPVDGDLGARVSQSPLQPLVLACRKGQSPTKNKKKEVLGGRGAIPGLDPRTPGSPEVLGWPCDYVV